MAERLYRVSFDTQRDKVYSSWEYMTMAPNKASAIETARDQWYASRKSHMFHCQAERVELPDVETQIKLNTFREVRCIPVTWGNIKR